jgi:LuxR family maltose regulon positive regulatory protein
MEDLSATRITLPRLHAELVERPQLQMQLDDALTRSKLVLLCAPAGYGKTVALVQKLRTLPADHAIAWVSASEDDDLQRLLATLLAALDPFDLPWRISPDALPSVALRDGGLSSVVSEVVRALARSEAEHGVMAFDDVHRIDDPRVFDFFERLLKALPARWTVAMTARVDPPLPLVRMLAARELAEFRQEELRFQREDVQALLTAAALPTSAERVDQLLERTQGWVVGLNMEIFAQRDPRRKRAQRLTFEYLTQEVFEKLPPQMQVFLLRCSMLRDLSVERCRRVSGDTRTAHWLNELERRGLFATVLEGEERTLHLHDLFREFLEGRLTRELVEEVPQLLRNAAQGERDLVRRVDYLLRAGATGEAAHEMLGAAGALIQAGAGEQLIRLIERFPEPLRTTLPELHFVRGMYAWHRFEFNSTSLLMQKAMTDFERCGEQQLAVQARGLASLALYCRGELAEAFAVWDVAPPLEMNPATEIVSALVTFVHSLQFGPYASSPDQLWRMVRLIPQIEADHWIPHFHAHHMAIGRWGMRAPMEALVDALLSAARDSRPHLKLPALRLQAWLAMWQGNVSAVGPLCREVVAEAHWLGNTSYAVVFNQILIAYERYLSGDYAQAKRILEELADDAGRNPQRRSRPLYLNLLGGLATASDDWTAAQKLLLGVDTSRDRPEWPYVGLQTATLRAEIALHDDHNAEAVALLRPVLGQAMDWDNYGVNARLRVALARAELRTGGEAAAWEVLGSVVRQAMQAGEPLGLLLCGPAALEELAQARWPDAADAAAVTYLRDCATRARQLRSGAQPPPSPAPHESPLSDRELQVLELVAQGHSNKLIARALGISPHTVKRHMARIFDKTGQDSRGRVAAWHSRHTA